MEMSAEEIKKWVKKDRVLIEGMKRYSQGEEIIDRAIDLTIRKITEEYKK